MKEMYRNALQWVNGLDRQDWLVLLVIAVALGFVWLRGFGSRTDY